MSQVVSTPQQICNHPLNSSKSKFMYSFSKASKDNLIQKPVYNFTSFNISLFYVDVNKHSMISQKPEALEAPHWVIPLNTTLQRPALIILHQMLIT